MSDKSCFFFLFIILFLLIQRATPDLHEFFFIFFLGGEALQLPPKREGWGGKAFPEDGRGLLTFHELF